MRDFLLDTQTVRYWYDDECAQHAAIIGNIELLKKQARPLEHKPCGSPGLADSGGGWDDPGKGV